MPQAMREGGEPAPRFDRLPVTIEPNAARTPALVRLLLLLPALALMLAPVGLLAASAAPALWAAAGNPLAAAQVLVGLVLWTALFMVPARRLLRRCFSERSVRIDAGMVRVCDRDLLGSRRWQTPLGEFAGLAHHVRSSLSGVRHELHLVHAERSKSLLLHAAERIPQATIDGAGALFGLPHIPPSTLYRFPRREQRPQQAPERAPERVSERAPEKIPEKIPEQIPEQMPEQVPERIHAAALGHAPNPGLGAGLEAAA